MYSMGYSSQSKPEDEGTHCAVWLEFFKEAGIKDRTTAATYAIAFEQHRIKMDMLGDLTTDVLQAMGLCYMGDIIAILKHAKFKHAQNTREKALGSSAAARTPPQQAVAKPLVTTQPQSKPELARRHVIPSQKALVQPLSPAVPKPSSSRTIISVTRDRSADNVSSGSSSDSGKIISLRPKQETEVLPVRRNRRVLPEHEGTYTVKMPAGTTERTRNILARCRLNKSSVFDRLGGSDDEVEECPSTKRIYISTSQSSSVFSRLGPSGSGFSNRPLQPQRGLDSTDFQPRVTKPQVSTGIIFRTVVNDTMERETGSSVGVKRRHSPIIFSSKDEVKDDRQKRLNTEGILGAGARQKITAPVKDRLTLRNRTGTGRFNKLVTKNALREKLAKGHRLETVTKADEYGNLKTVKVLKKISAKKAGGIFDRLG